MDSNETNKITNDDISSTTDNMTVNESVINNNQNVILNNNQTPVINNINMRTISGVLSQTNLNAIDWSFDGLIAFGSHNRVIIVETKNTLKVCQSLHKHNAAVCVVKWCINSTLKLASADTSGKILVWDVFEPSVLSVISGTKENKSIISLEWLNLLNNSKNCSQNYLLVIYSPNNLCLYDPELGELLWNKNYSKSIKNISLNPFCATEAIFGFNANECCFGVISDLNANKCPNGEFVEYRVTIKESNAAQNLLRNSSSGPLKYELLIKGQIDETKSNYYNLLNECLHVAYHRSVRNQVYVVFSREILMIDISMKAVICAIPIERSCSNLVHVYSCKHRNALFACHEFGTVSLRIYQKRLVSNSNHSSNILQINYTTICQSDGLRLSKQNKIFGYCLSPMDETKVALLLNNGRLIVKTLRKTNQVLSDISVPFLSDLIPLDEYNFSESKKLNKNYHLLMTDLLPSLSFGPFVIRMCPPVTLRNWPFHKPYLAIGDSCGMIQIWNLSTAILEREFSIHSYTVRGIEWTSLETFISFAYPTVSYSGKVNNELNITDINSGRTAPVRGERNNDSSPIESLKISHLKQYLIISFKDEPFEIWDLKALSLLRVMPKQFASITAIEWSPLYNKRIENVSDKSSDNQILQYLPSKENFVVTNSNGDLYHFSIEGHIVKEITCIPPDSEMNGNITCIAWKSDQVLLGDAIGNLYVWDLKKKNSRTESTYRSMIKKIKFGPGRGNMKFLVLYNDGVDIWDIKDFKLHSQLKYPRDISFKIEDIDWAGSDRPILATSESTIFITDLNLKQYTSSLSDLIMDDIENENINVLHSLNFHFLPPMSQFIYKSKLILNQLSDGPILPNCDIERVLLVSKLFNDTDAYTFWNIAFNVITDNKNLDLSYDIFLDNNAFRDIYREKVALLESIRTNYSQNKICSKWHMFLSQQSVAVHLLLETDPQSNDYYSDALKACLIASLESNEESISVAHPIVKLVATNLIANGKVDEGCQLLCLIGKTQDACRYLQSANKWYESVWLAKCSLENDEYYEIMRRFCDYLMANNYTKTAILILLSLKQYSKVIQVLSKDDIERAFLFASICLKRKLIDIEDNKIFFEEMFDKYSKFLSDAGLDQAIEYYKQLMVIST